MKTLYTGLLVMSMYSAAQGAYAGTVVDHPGKEEITLRELVFYQAKDKEIFDAQYSSIQAQLEEGEKSGDSKELLAIQLAQAVSHYFTRADLVKAKLVALNSDKSFSQKQLSDLIKFSKKLNTQGRAAVLEEINLVDKKHSLDVNRRLGDLLKQEKEWEDRLKNNSEWSSVEETILQRLNNFKQTVGVYTCLQTLKRGINSHKITMTQESTKQLQQEPSSEHDDNDRLRIAERQISVCSKLFLGHFRKVFDESPALFGEKIEQCLEQLLPAPTK